MSKGNVGLWKATYKEAIEYIRKQNQIELPPFKINKRTTLEKYRNIWKQIRKAHRIENTDLPDVRVVAKESLRQKEHEFDYEETIRDENMNTAPASFEDDARAATAYIKGVIEQIKQIYDDTKRYIASAPLNKKGNIKDPEFYFLSLEEEAMDASYQEIMMMIDSLRNEYGDVAVAKELAQDPEIEYTFALVFLPPSDTKNNFQSTVQQWVGIARRLASQMKV